MGLRKGGGKKKGSRKRKANVWDDAEVQTKRGVILSKNDALPRKSRYKGSMMSQWKAQRIAERMKERRFFVSVEEKKRWQREHYKETWEHTANAIYKKKEAGEEEIQEIEEDKEESEESESEDSEEDVMDGKSSNALFDEFVKTFTREEPAEEEDEEEEEEEEVVVMDEELEEENETKSEDEEEKDSNETQEQVAAMEKDDEEQVEEQDEDEQEDPYRRRYLLSSFSEQDAKKFDAQMRKFTKVELLTLDDANKYDITYRKGVSEDIEGVAGVVTTPENAVKKKPYVRSRLMTTWTRRGLDAETVFPKGSVERTLWQQLLAYTDVFFACQTYENTPTLRRLSAMHVLNHVLKARDTVTRNNERLKKRDSEKVDDAEEKEYRDQGFCRASVLVLLPLRSAAVAFVNQLLELLPSNMDTFHNKDRFFIEFGSGMDDNNHDVTKDNDKKEWQRVFSAGNNDDCFQLGISFSRKAMRFYSEYHHADIILASPLGLRQQLGDEVAMLDEITSSGDMPQLSSDFLSSIEVCIVDSISLMAMQNLEHLRTVLRAMNVPPKEAPYADFARVRDWNLAFLASYFRQTVVFGHGVEPIFNALLKQTCCNVSGLVKYVSHYDLVDGSASMSRVVREIRHLFQRIDFNDPERRSPTPLNEVEGRFEYFRTQILDPLLAHPRKHVLIVIPSYFDYVRVRNVFHESMTEKLIQSVQCCEYTTSSQISRARTSFYHGYCHVMLYTERFHFYHQYAIRGIEHLIWYGVPQWPDFYPELVNLIRPGSHESGPHDHMHSLDQIISAEPTSIVLFTRFDYLRLQRIVGNKRAQRMCQAKNTKSTFLFY
ncbi:unnamed protein product [Peronospora belbahrii]|uniref:Digestive organ expansion factor n=1 Tax=Peronospora belbahrii TaxID=622444 RepID=A0AAU9L5L1_9STRA|nr:unnamed protein product [Peronospora belbahrii]CAH0513261.1 unnamed protein product [Peronospora belbahrii]